MSIMKSILPILADLANGIFAVLLVSTLTGHEIVWWYFLIGMMFAMSPDIDAIPELLVRGKVAASADHPSDHRTFLHYPILSIPLGFLAAWLFPFWGMVWLVALVLHLINDLYGTGWGIPLLYPFSNKKYKLAVHTWFQKDRTGTAVVAESWSPDELQKVIVEQGNENWIADTYLTFTWIAVTEYSLFIVAIVLALCSLLY